MPTFGFILDTIEDRRHERGGEGPRQPRTVPCPICGESLPTEVAVAEHLGSAHPLSAPRLLIDGAVVVGERFIFRRLGPEGVEVANSTDLRVSENGGPPQPWSLQALRDTLFEADSLVLDISLRNRRAGDGAAALEQVRLRLDIPAVGGLAAADRCFEEFLADDDLNEHQLDRFVDAAAETPGAARYASALHDYGVAILVKGQARGTGQSMPFATHREKLQRSLSVLGHFPERPVARVVCGFIRFGLNDLSGGTHPSGSPQLDECTAALQELAGVHPLSVVPMAELAAAGRCPTDATTACILDRWRGPAGGELLAELAARGATTPEDSAKCRALALRAAAKDSPTAEYLARGLTSDPVFGAWATRIIEDAVADG
jgi:hypothetical protein